MKVQAKKLKETVRETYANAARAVQRTGANPPASCGCGAMCCSSGTEMDFTKGAYAAPELAELPDEARLASLGCGNPTALASLRAGEIVLDLGSGGGIDVLLSAKRVGPTGKAYGLDMTDEMLALARDNQRRSGLANVEFIKGDIEEIPLPNDHVDVIISNCVINLAADKDQVLREAYRVLNPGGRFAVSDIVFLGDKGHIPADILRKVEAWASCMAGALTDAEYKAKLQAAGFTDISIEVAHVYTQSDMEQWIGPTTWADNAVQIVSAFVRASKPEQVPAIEHSCISQIADFAQSLSDPLRVQILALLLQGGHGCCEPDSETPVGVCVCEITEQLQLSQSKVSYHIAKLKEVGLVREEQSGKWNYYTVVQDKAREMLDLCAAFFRTEAR